MPFSWGAHEGAGPLSGSREASFRAEPATECGSNPIARSKSFRYLHLLPLYLTFRCSDFRQGSDPRIVTVGDNTGGDGKQQQATNSLADLYLPIYGVALWHCLYTQLEFVVIRWPN